MSKLDTLTAKSASLDTTIKGLESQLDESRRQRSALECQIRREQLREQIGQPVKRRYRFSQHPLLNDAVGTLVDVRRTKCTVEYAEELHGCKRWIFDINCVAPVAEEQGLTIELEAGVLQ